MPVVTRSTAVRRRNIVRKLTWVIRERMLEDEPESESEYDSDTDYYPSDSESETEYEVECECECESDAESDAESIRSEDGDTMQERIDYLRSELAEAETMMKKRQAEQECVKRDNTWCSRFIATIVITVAIYGWLGATIPSKQQVRW